MRLLILCACLCISAPVSAQSLRLATTAYALSAAADKATTLNCTLRVGCGEATPGYAWLNRKSPALQMAVSTSVDVASVLAWNRIVGRNHPKLAAVGLFGMAVLRGSVAARNYQRVHRAY